MKNLKNQRVTKKTVKDLKEKLKGVDENTEVILAFYYLGEVHHIYLAEILTNLKYDGVTGEKLNESSVVELSGFDDDYCTYLERNDDV
ncbi:MAG: hypothetical protein J6Y78_04545 [Paludibacteraceae bacterium]|nr:hypothetical protein [Paludibacteraceae bacterium]